jgi:hypothetical protein
LQQAIEESIASADFVRSAADYWTAAERDLDQTWEEQWQKLAPGEDVLVRVWKKYDRSYNKERDGPEIARAMSAPDELREVLESLFRD